LIDDEVHVLEKETNKKKKTTRINDATEVEGERMFRCSEGDCQYVSKKASSVKTQDSQSGYS